MTKKKPMFLRDLIEDLTIIKNSSATIFFEMEKLIIDHE